LKRNQLNKPGTIGMGKKAEGPQNTVQVRLYPTPGQAMLLMAHAQEYISTVNVLVQACDAGMIEEGFSTKDFTAGLPSACKNQALRDAKSVHTKALKIGRIPTLKKPICQWNNQNWQMEPGHLTLPVFLDGKTQQISMACVEGELVGAPGILRIKKKRGKWIADITMTLPQPPPSQNQGVMGIDLGIKVPAVSYVQGKTLRFYGNGRSQRSMRRRFYARRKSLQKAGKKRALRKSQGKERHWMKNINHQLSRQIVNHAQQDGVGTIKLETLFGIRERTTRTSRGAKARKNNRMSNTWAFYQLAQFITYKAERLGMKVERVDPAYTSQECPACGKHNKAQDRRYCCSDCGWKGHRDSVGAIAISRRTGVSGKRKRATGSVRRSASGWAS
jgi:IS605 OrfB family transposase